MFARVASFEGGNTEKPQAVDEEPMAGGTVELPEGASRAQLLGSEAGDRRLFSTFFDDRGALDAAEARFEPMGDETPEEVRGRRTSVEADDVSFER